MFALDRGAAHVVDRFGEDLANFQLLEGARVGRLADDGGIRAAARSGDSNDLLIHIQQTRVGGHSRVVTRHPEMGAVADCCDAKTRFTRFFDAALHRTGRLNRSRAVVRFKGN